MSLALHTHARVDGAAVTGLYKVLTLEEAVRGAYPSGDVLLWEAAAPGYAGSVFADEGEGTGLTISRLRDPAVIQPGDVVRVRPGSTMVSVMYRRGSAANTLFATERCNSRCLMCSQPPRTDDDGWRVAELLRLIDLIDHDEAQLGISGGEPTLLGDDLGRLIDACARRLPDTHLHILSNGRTFCDRAVAASLGDRGHPSLTWGVPLYADHAELHDEVVDAHGAFEETIQGLYELGRLGARIEIRVVLHGLTVDRLPQLASYIYRRLPFVEHVALMGLEPMGYAKTNRERLWIDPADYLRPLADAVFFLAHRGLPVSIYNLPLCVLPESLWPYARQSISDWKNTFAPECAGCELVASCSGFFASAGPAWRSRAVRPLKLLETAA
ncbi:MAG: His-Xaa-Ser system radical SAM maturase HxsC [Alphaproteobacteria bacterium]|jgi:His-Xaa-Ser system radical SAM maturase HxsC|nr:His-Xaa-Ser system radical SAM maturase HxsC [Alphaproteobacteria bacterium]MBU2041367.1 His-Xaa-Ser system radical SAM maturase HxsC [Alphaproteobacteria bacterium]MBU2125396.1 His-Xaa-Ser system radical SAM maturase HxsC [Alphaproteobacteria bacterium]MBU2209558.1 His-Xaa-Ser system radical SAM maturase HxsC [Alphaproteobacteria bacterium]MBU2290004.1 His-Xaa-Ser system radical SAM maturase HxsC [Alphaproteobacteria bacterium]